MQVDISLHLAAESSDRGQGLLPLQGISRKIAHLFESYIADIVVSTKQTITGSS